MARAAALATLVALVALHASAAAFIASLLAGHAAEAARPQPTLSFEQSELPDGLSSSSPGSLSLSSACAKDGRQSLHWRYRAGDTLLIRLAPQHMSRRAWQHGGVRLWIRHRRDGQAAKPPTSERRRGTAEAAPDCEPAASTASAPSTSTISTASAAFAASTPTASAPPTAPPQRPGVLRIDFIAPDGSVLTGFDYNLQDGGWRACWMSFRRMRESDGRPGTPEPSEPSEPSGPEQLSGALPQTCRITAPDRDGELWLDRLVLPEEKADPRTAPDEQVPNNALVSSLRLGHWSLLLRWQQQTWNLPLKDPSARARRDMRTLEARLDRAMCLPTNTAADEARRAQLWSRFGIERSPECGGFRGAPLLCADECDPAAGDLSWRDLDELMKLLASASAAGDGEAAQQYLLLWEYALDQGFAAGSCMGTNHHYGYATRNIFRSAWLMRHEIERHPARRPILDALRYWSGLHEVKRPPAADRADRCDSWNTLLLPRLMVALMEPRADERERWLRGLARWLNASLQNTPGTMGGIKADGTTFHHDGFYPAYANDGLSAVGHYAELCAGTAYGLSPDARAQLRRALETLRNCANLRDWPLGLSGRHPFRHRMTDGCVQAFARLAALEKGESARRLQGDYERLSAEPPAARRPGRDSASARPTASSRPPASARASDTARDSNADRTARTRSSPRRPSAPEGFFAYNHAAAGVYRVGEAMALMKGFNQDVWGSEIYTRDNRYGRYQSYGSLCILGSGSPVTQAASGFVEAGWDWNRVPGATTIHLPLDLLESPRSSTLMAYNPQSFAGAGSLKGQAGLFALHLREADERNFTSDFTARKSVFCCGGQLLCLGSGISNGNSRYPTETTLFQCAESACTDPDEAPEGWIADGTGNYFRVLEGELREASGLQSSRDNKTKRETQGRFRAAWLHHGTAPSQARYAYLILMQPDARSLRQAAERPAFAILEQSSALHAARHLPTNTWALASFEASEVAQGPVRRLPAGLIVLARPEGDSSLTLSITDPNLHLPRHGRFVTEEGETVQHTLILRGRWSLVAPTPGATITPHGDAESRLQVSCRLGLPVELSLRPRRP